MKKFSVPIVFLLLGLPALTSCLGGGQSSGEVQDVPQEDGSNYVTFVQNEAGPKIDVFIDGKLFTSYIYANPILRKPVLFPIYTASEQRVTRGFPLATNPGERTDHPHHHGLWFNHGVVNKVDFWNSAVVSKKSSGRYGRINHIKVINIQPGAVGTLEVEKHWRSDVDELLIKEHTRYVFSGEENFRGLAHITTLTAIDADVLFEDSKEGLFAIRVRRELELGDDPITSGRYRNSRGLTGYPEVWGKRAEWMELAGEVEGEPVSISILDHPDNPNHPPHWMARDYGLFAVNPLGSAVYTNGKEQFNFNLKRGESVTFKNQLLITNGSNPEADSLEFRYNDFAADY